MATRFPFRFRRFARAALAFLLAFQVAATTAAPPDACPMGDCEHAVECLQRPCNACAILPLPAPALPSRPADAGEAAFPDYAGRLVAGLPSDIWRPPRARD